MERSKRASSTHRGLDRRSSALRRFAHVIAIGCAVLLSVGTASAVASVDPRFQLHDEQAPPLLPVGSAIELGDPGDRPLVGDWDGDGDQTIGVYRPHIGHFFLKNDSRGAVELGFGFGNVGDRPLVGDWDGDGDETIGVWRPGNAHFYLSNTNAFPAVDHMLDLGAPGDVPLTGDWDGDGKDSIGLYRPSTRQFLLRNALTSGGADAVFEWADTGDLPVVGDWDGDGIDTVGVYQAGSRVFWFKAANDGSAAASAAEIDSAAQGAWPIAGDWNGDGRTTVGMYRTVPDGSQQFYLHDEWRSMLRVKAIDYGIPGDRPVTGDWDGDGSDTIGAYRPGNRYFFLSNANSAGASGVSFDFGGDASTPLTGDWDGDGDDTIGTYVPAAHQFFLKNTNASGFGDIGVDFGEPGDVPLVGDWDGDGDDTIGVYRPGTRQFLLRNSNSAGAADVTIEWGNFGDQPFAGDWDGDGTDTVGLYQPQARLFWLKTRNDGTPDAQRHELEGMPYGETPLAGDWNGDGRDTIGLFRAGDHDPPADPYPTSTAYGGANSTVDTDAEIQAVGAYLISSSGDPAAKWAGLSPADQQTVTAGLLVPTGTPHVELGPETDPPTAEIAGWSEDDRSAAAAGSWKCRSVYLDQPYKQGRHWYQGNWCYNRAQHKVRESVINKSWFGPNDDWEPFITWDIDPQKASEIDPSDGAVMKEVDAHLKISFKFTGGWVGRDFHDLFRIRGYWTGGHKWRIDGDTGSVGQIP